MTMHLLLIRQKPMTPQRHRLGLDLWVYGSVAGGIAKAASIISTNP